MATTSDIFGKTIQSVDTPLTADRAVIMINDQVVAGVQNISINYQQAIQRRHEIGGRRTLLYSTQPVGAISIASLVAFYNVPGVPAGGFPKMGTGIWNACDFTNPSERQLKLQLFGGPCQDGVAEDLGSAYIATGCVITGWNLQAESESLSIATGVSIEFVQLLDTTPISLTQAV